MSVLASGDAFVNISGLLTGIAEILGLVGAGIAFLVRSRRNARRERLRTETAAGLAAQEAKKQLEARLERQHNEQVEQLRQQVADLNARQEAEKDDLERSYQLQVEQFKTQVRDLMRDRDALLRRLLDQGRPRESKRDE